MIGRDESLEIEIVTSRRALIDVIIGRADYREAPTVLGGHAVIEITRDVPTLLPDVPTGDRVLGGRQKCCRHCSRGVAVNPLMGGTSVGVFPIR